MEASKHIDFGTRVAGRSAAQGKGSAGASRSFLGMNVLSVILFLLLILLTPVAPMFGQTAAMHGVVTDPSGAVVPGAMIALTRPSGSTRATKSKRDGKYSFSGLAPGRYTVTVKAKGFAALRRQNVTIPPGRPVLLDLRLAITSETQRVTVRGRTSHLEIAPQSNASALVISGKSSIDALSNDPDELQNQLTALAGPAVGPPLSATASGMPSSGGQVYINGFQGGDMPPKSAIREIRVNANPFSAENDRFGYGRVDILTKAGGAAFHGDASAEYNDSSMNALSPFLAASSVPPPAYHTWLFNGDVGGPIGKKASFFLGVERRNINRANLVNTDILSPSLSIEPYVASVLNPQVYTNIGPRLDFQLSPNNTLSVNYRYLQISERNKGVDTQSLPSQAYDEARHHHNIQIIDTQVLGPRLVNETSFQVVHSHKSETPQNFSPTLDVLGAFTGGGGSFGTYNDSETHYTLHNYATMTLGHHLVRFGGRLLVLPRRESTNGNFNGTFTFNSLSDYKQTLQGLRNGLMMAQIQAAGYGPSQFSITAGKLSASIARVDGALFVSDDWSLSPHFTASYGLRLESENDVSSHAYWAPRVGIAWGLGHGSNTKTVLRAGWGIFYQYLDDDHMMIAGRLNGQNQQTYIVNNPDFFPAPPSIAVLKATATSSPTIFRIAPNLLLPYDMDTAVSLERQLLPSTTVSVTYVNSRGVHEYVANDINAPLPGTFNPADPTSGVRPLGNALGNIYNYESAAAYRQTELIANINVRANRVSLFGYYVFDDAHGNAGLNVQSSPAGDFSFQTNPWNLSEDYGRAHFDIRHSAVIGGSFVMPLGIRLSSLLMANSGLPFSIQLPQDLYGTGVHDARPAPATASTPPADVVVTKFGTFNIAPGPENAPILPNTENGPANFMLNFRLSRTFGFGGNGGRHHGGQGTAPTVSGHDHRRGLGGRGLSSLGGSGLGGATERRYALTISLSVLNALNNVNLAPPIGVIGSPLFGSSIALAGGPFSAQVGNPVANRLVNVGVSFSF